MAGWPCSWWPPLSLAVNFYKLAQKLRARATRIEKRARQCTNKRLAHAMRLDVDFLRRLANRADPRLRRQRKSEQPEAG